MNAKIVLVLIAVVCFAIAVLNSIGAVSIGKLDWQALGLFFGFLSFLV